MAGRIILGMLPKRSFLSVSGINFWGRFSRCSFSTAQKIENASKAKIPLTEAKNHNSKMPTYEQVKDSSELQVRLAEMYKQQADDPDFQEITRYSMKMGLQHLRTHYKKQ